MNYLLYGTMDKLINEFISKIKNDLEVTKYNYLETTLDEIISDASYNDLFGNKKIIVVDNSTFFTSSEEDTTNLEKYIENPNENTTLIFTINEEKLDGRKKITKLFKSKNLIKEFNELDIKDLNKKIKDSFLEENYIIDSLSINEIITRCKSNYNLITNEIEKLKMYKYNEKEITLEDVKNVVDKALEDDVFKLTNAVTSGNKKKILEVYNEIIETGTDEIKIMVMLANDFRLMYELKIMNKTYNEKELADILKIHPYRAKIMLENSRYYDEKDLEKILNELSDLDYKIKSGLIDKKIGLELFLFSY